MTEIIGVRFKSAGKVYYFSPDGMKLDEGSLVIVETARGVECGEVVMTNRMVEDGKITAPLKAIIRQANQQDLKILEQNKAKEENAFRICQEKIAGHKLDMKLVDVECTFDNNKLLFYFTAETRVDFRELVKDLAAVFRTRIELRQIGVRDEAKILGGLGICGRPFCCSQFIDEFQPVSTKMAKVQSMSLNPGKISGSCGRLMCCLRYEQEAYEELTKNVPKQGAFVETPAGYGIVTQVNLLRQMVKVKLDGEGDDTVKTYRAVEVAAVPGGRPKDGETPPSVLKYVPEPEVEEEEETDIWKLPELFADDGSDKDKESAPAQKKRSRNRRSRRGGKTPQSDATPVPQPAQAPSAEEKKTTAKPKPRNRRGGGKKPAEQSVSAEQPKPQQQAKSPDGEKKRSNRRYYHRGKPKNKGGQAQDK